MNNNIPITLGIDFGTSSLKCMLIECSGAVIAESEGNYTTYTKHKGWSEQEPSEWLTALKEAIDQLWQIAPDSKEKVACIGICSAAHIPVLLDKNKRPLRKAILWTDQRSQKQVEWLKKNYGQYITDTTGNQVSTTWTLPQLRWVLENEPEIIEKTKYFLTSKDYILFSLTDAIATDTTSASSTLFYSPENKQWDGLLLEQTGLCYEVLPQVVDPLDIAGVTTKEAAAKFNLPENIPVIAGMMDSSAELIAAGAAKRKQGLIRLGTAGGIMPVFSEMQSSPGLISYPHPIDGLWYQQAGTNSCTLSLQWLRNFFKTSGKPDLSYSELDDMVEAAQPGADGLIFHPYLQGERTPYWEPFLRASFIGAGLNHSNEDFARAVMEGVGYSLRDCMRLFNDDTVNHYVMVGGGSKSRVWPQIIADILNTPISLVNNGNSTYGIALAAATATGFYDDITETIDKCVKYDKTIYPNKDRARYYKSNFDKYHKIKVALTPVYACNNSVTAC